MYQFGSIASRQGFQLAPVAGKICQLLHVNLLPTFPWKLPQISQLTYIKKHSNRTQALDQESFVHEKQETPEF